MRFFKLSEKGRMLITDIIHEKYSFTDLEITLVMINKLYYSKDLC